MNDLADFEESSYRYIIGIDLGTTNSAIAYVDRTGVDSERRRIRFLEIPQLITSGELGKLPILPSFLYIPGQYELPQEAIALPWDSKRGYVVGEFAREQGALVPGRLVSSAKSWLCHGGVDRTAPILPWGTGSEVEKLSAVEASSRYLQHIKEVWNESKAGNKDEHRLEAQLVILTIPASFDEVARELTVNAARQAGISRVILVEEPLAAFYAWLSKRKDDWQDKMQPGHLILVCDVGGGTTDFTIVAVKEGERGLRFDRLAVGDHLMLGGDNMDLALARHMEAKVLGNDSRLDSKRWHQLWHQCRKAKEILLTQADDAEPKTSTSVPTGIRKEAVDITIMGSGQRLIAGTLKGTLTYADVEQLILDGFFPFVSRDEVPKGGRRTGLTEWGLPYAQDPAVTRHLAAFWQRFQGLLEEETGRAHVYPDFVLFNGGALTPLSVRNRILAVAETWFNDVAGYGWAPQELENPRPELAVAIGAAYYGLVRLGEGVRVGAGSPRSYYVGIEAGEESEASESDVGDISSKYLEDETVHTVLCLIPRGTEEGFHARLDQPSFQVLTNQPVSFQLFSSSTRLGDHLGAVVEVPDSEVTTLPPIRTVLRYGKKGSAQTLPVQLVIRLTEVGTLELWCQSLRSDHKWQLQFDVRHRGEVEQAEPAYIPGETLDASVIEEARDQIRSTFQSGSGGHPPERLAKGLTSVLDLGREKWSTRLIRDLADALLEVKPGRRLSSQYEARWFNLLGFCMRPGFGDPIDEWRIKDIWKIYPQGLEFPRQAQNRSEWWIFWRRVAGGLSAGHQWHIYQHISPLLHSGDRKKKSAGRLPRSLSSQEVIEVWMMLANFERLPAKIKLDLGSTLLEKIRKGKPKSQDLWVLSRLGERIPFYGPLDQVISGDEAAVWVEGILSLELEPTNALAHAMVQLARFTGDRHRDVPQFIRDRLLSWLDPLPQPDRFKHLLTQSEVVLMGDEEDWIFGEALPSGLVLVQ